MTHDTKQARVPGFLASRLKDDCPVRLAEDGIWTALPGDAPEAEYDAIGKGYDWLVKRKLYTRLVWDADVADWEAYAARALESARGGALLDIACGSLTFTDRVYARARRPTVLLDNSIVMLRMGRERLAALGRNPDVALLVADGFALPFRDGSFQTVACHGALHVFDDMVAPLGELRRCVAPGGQLFVTCLVDNGRWIARKYMEMMRRSGHFGILRTAGELAGFASEAWGLEVDVTLGGNLAYLHAVTPA